MFENEKRFIVVFNDVTEITRIKYLESVSEYKS